MKITTLTLNLRKTRKIFDITQTKAAECCGVKRATFQSWEEGRAQPSAEMLVNIATVFGIENLQAFISDPDFDYHNQYKSSSRFSDHPVLTHYRHTKGSARRAIDILLGIDNAGK